MKTVLLYITSLSFFLILIAPCQGQSPNFILEKRVGVQVNTPEDVAVDSEGNIYFSSTSVTKFSYHEFLGTEFLDYAPEGLNLENYGSFNITLDQHDQLFVVSNTFAKVAKFSKEGKLLLEFGVEGEGEGQFKYPEEIAVNSKEEIYVADSGNKRIQRFDKNGKLLQIIPLEESTGSYFEAPLSIDFDAEDNLYLLHNPANKVIKYSPLGEKLFEFGNGISDIIKLENPWKLAVDKKTGHVIISDLSLKGFYIYNSEGELGFRMAHNYGIPKLSGTMLSIAITPDENFVIADRRPGGDSQIIMYTKGGEGLHRWGHHWQNDDLAIDEEGGVYLLETSGRITKFNANGEVVKNFGGTSSPVFSSEKGIDVIVNASKAIAADIFNNIYVLSSPTSSDDTPAIFKLDKEGNQLARFTDFGPSASTHQYSSLAVDASGTMYVADMDGGVVLKINSKGQYVGTVGNPGYEPGQVWMPLAVAIDRTGVLHVLDYNGGRIQQFNSSGKFIREFGTFSKNDSTFLSNSDMALDGNGNIFIASNLHQNRFWIFNAKGDLLHEELGRQINHIAVDQRGSRLIVDDYQADAYSLYLATDYEEPKNIIKGVVYADANNNCVYNEGEITLSGIAVMATPGPHYAITGNDGSYTLAIDSGNYTLQTILPTQAGRTITATCPLPAQGSSVAITAPGQIVQNVDFGNTVFSPPYLAVSVSSDRRRCFDSTTKLTYSNTGFAPANNAKVYLQLPAQVELLSADKPYTRLPNGTYVFDAGTVAAGQRSVITIQDKVVCGDESIRGMTVCTRAWITPGNQSPTAPPAPVISITGTCNPETGKVRFVIKNTGQVDMEESEQFRKYVDGLLSTVEDYRLAAGDSMVLWVPAGGRTVRLEADQPDGNGDNTMASTTVEACSTVAISTAISTGFVNVLPTDDEEAEVAEECLPIIDSFDPNDKLVLPVGRTEENFTPTGVALKYKIRFQNTGTDVAYRVVVVDTLSEHLDLSTLQIGSASHAYRYELSGKGKPVLTWTFDNIMLPDSTSNEPGSHGYIQFSIKPKADLPEKTAVENYADIFFDFNSPIRTNITVNRIYDMPLVIDETVRINLEQIIATPAILSFAPAAGKYGTEVRLSGKRFSATAASNKVYFNGLLAPVVSASETELRVLVPANAALFQRRCKGRDTRRRGKHNRIF